jgi:E3 ubiquitin-protein ligase HUWE1
MVSFIDLDYLQSDKYLSRLPLRAELLLNIKEDGKSDLEKLHLEILQELFGRLDMDALWKLLGSVMDLIDKNDQLIHIATVLLPLIESYMVVSKPSVSILKAQQPKEVAKVSSLKHHENNQSTFLAFAESHKKVLNAMVRNNPSLMNGSFSLLVQNPKVLEFDNKRSYFNLQLHKGNQRGSFPPITINVRRNYVFEESYQQLQGKTGDFFKYGKLNVRFRDEEGVDAGGVTREWFSALALQMFNPDYALFKPSTADKVTYQPNRASGINPDHLFYFKFVGRIIGKAIYDGRLLDAYFTRSFYKCMISAPVDYKDMEATDLEFYKSLDWILHNDITDVLDLTFSIEVDDFGVSQIIDLIPDGRNMSVTESNKTDYVKLVTEQRLITSINEQIKAFLEGFLEIIPKDLIRIFNEQELELLISGLPDIDIDDWKNNTEYQNYNPSSVQVQWFWRAVRSFTQEERAKLLQFTTGTSKVPLGGFSKLQGSTGIQKFQIHKEFSSPDRLPSAHTWYLYIT